mmetsp:Transcript_5574/g.10593  ORF Transcript_5574/g.10593 Transcript_5574/m.10593 type:complete len:230 (-) Transcript_5574:742-1431(-)|eukprot:CAMPEP_0176500888 /NCGR_PEP_ID=MMETSP0200_2-20121128/13839_1 /TAXON_ID=947934 /ORGANISM="Chaetoceros sp., Strain GSL56" /LENGTH=229 /DNA_ID=CAMNT_0017899681 /DNA_START=169 /DNA_END=858 /DNA_ORIENTATION=-
MMITSFLIILTLANMVYAWVNNPINNLSTRSSTNISPSSKTKLFMSTISVGARHGENACFLPLEQCHEEYYAPRIVQIAGLYPGITKEEFKAVTSSPAAELGQWAYDFSDPDGPQMGTVALPGSEIIAACEDPVVIIAEHFALGVPLPDVLKDPVDLLVLVDRAKKGFSERKFLVVDVPGEGVLIKAFTTKSEIPEGSEILGRVDFVQVPWLPCMQKKRSGFMEDDQLY